MREFEISTSGYTFKISLATQEADPGEVDPLAQPKGSGDFYVYAHRDINGKIFYIGKRVR